MHIPVLQKEVIEYLDPKPNENFIDATIDGGGHAAAILEKNGPDGKILGIEIDKDLYERLAAETKNQEPRTENRLILVNDSYINLKEIVEKNNFGPVSGILFDLGMSSWQIQESGRGFSFLRDEVLNMRYDDKNQDYLTAEKIVNDYSEKEIEQILREYGEERLAGRIAKAIIDSRKIKPIKTTFQLAEIIKKAVPFYKRQKINPATRTFQALRIEVNQELQNLEKVLPQALEILEFGGRLAVISFHSLEDRIVKNFLKKHSDKTKILTKKPVIANKEEIKENPHSRSAKLRAALKT